MATTRYIAALDVGDRRIGVAIAHRVAALPAPLLTLENDASLWGKLQQLIAEQQIDVLVVGLPRGLDGQETAQTRSTQAFVEELRKHVSLPVYWQDEALTSVQAETELQSSGKRYNKGMVDALAACLILKDYLETHREQIDA